MLLLECWHFNCVSSVHRLNSCVPLVIFPWMVRVTINSSIGTVWVPWIALWNASVVAAVLLPPPPSSILGLCKPLTGGGGHSRPDPAICGLVLWCTVCSRGVCSKHTQCMVCCVVNVLSVRFVVGGCVVNMYMYKHLHVYQKTGLPSMWTQLHPNHSTPLGVYGMLSFPSMNLIIQITGQLFIHNNVKGRPDTI